MNKSKISYLVLSDIHLGHNKTPTEYIIKNLLNYFQDNHNLFSKLDIIFIAGDVYDKLLTPSSKEFILANEWLSMLAMYCSKYNIKLRILEGTPSHDWKQVSVFSTTLEKLKIDIDYKYFDKLDIEVMDDLGISILYVPDEWNHEAKDTLNEVQALLKQYHLEQVDIAIMHGQFKYQIPMIELPSSHDEEAYHQLVKYYINIGHIHTSSVNGRILAQGSFDRLAHGEEEDKGGMVMTLYHTGDMEFMFIKNKNAHPYITYQLENKSLEEIIKYLDNKLPKLKPKTKVRIKVTDVDVRSLLKSLQDKYKLLEISVVKEKEQPKNEIIENKVKIEPFEIKPDNIKDLIFKELDNYNLTKEELSIAEEELMNFI